MTDRLVEWEGALAKRKTDQGEGGRPAGSPGSVASAAAVLRLLADADQPLGVNAVARELTLAPSSCFRILKALLTEGFVEIDANKNYSVGGTAIAVARRALDPLQAYPRVRARLEEVAESQSIAIGFWHVIPRSRLRLIGFAEDGQQQTRIHMSIGQRLPMFVGAIGRAMAAQLGLPPAKLKEHFDTLHWGRPPSFSEYLEQVGTARRLGYGMDVGNFAAGVATVGVAVLDRAANPRFGLSGIMFDGQHDPAAMARIAGEIVKLGQWVSRDVCDLSIRR